MRSGESKYPVKAGDIIKLLKPIPVRNDNFSGDIDRKKFNRIFKKTSKGPRLYHTTYYWIERHWNRIPGKKENYRTFIVYMVFVPNLNGMEERFLHDRRKMTKKTIARRMKENDYEIIGNVEFNYEAVNYNEFYRAIGLLPQHISA